MMMKHRLLPLLAVVLTSCSTVASSFHYTRGTECLDRGDCEGAIKELTKAVELDPEMARNHTNLSFAYLSCNHYDKAWYHIRQAVLCPYQDSAGYINFMNLCQAMVINPKLNEPGTPLEEVRRKLGEPDIEINNDKTLTYIYGLCVMEFEEGQLIKCTIN